jgi:hypothetical protein
LHEPSQEELHPQSAIAGGARFGGDAPWLAVLLAITAVETCWWLANWQVGTAPAPYLLTHIALAFAGLGAALMLRLAVRPAAPAPNWPNVVPTTIMIGVGASQFLPLKYAIPKLVPFWLDVPLAQVEKLLFGIDPWLALDRCLGWLAVPMDWLYGLWLPTQALILFLVLLQRGSPAKSRVLISYVLAWFLLGVVGATFVSSAGPIFYDRLYGGTEFAGLRETLQKRGVWVALGESDRMWASLAGGRPTIVAGISAVPSVHVAISFWMFLAARLMAPRAVPYALVYAVLIWIGSVQLGWHYVTDGFAGLLGMVAVWNLGRHLEVKLGAYFAGVRDSSAIAA